MCNLYSMTKNQAAIRNLFKVDRDITGNLPPMPGIFPDKMAPIIRNSADGRELAMLRWGMPSSSAALSKRRRPARRSWRTRANQLISRTAAQGARQGHDQHSTARQQALDEMAGA
jgi:putative SOS response-associated peptidase YedK